MSTCNSDNKPNKTIEQSPPPVEPIRLPTIEEVRGQDIWNNCAVRSVVSGVMGLFPFYFSILFTGFQQIKLCQCWVEQRKILHHTITLMLCLGFCCINVTNLCGILKLLTNLHVFFLFMSREKLVFHTIPASFLKIYQFLDVDYIVLAWIEWN